MKAYFLFILQCILPPLALLALTKATWYWLVVAIIIFFLMRCVGYTITYHRIITHQTHRMHPAVESLGLLLGFYGSMSTPLESASIHNNHHRFMDTPRDPHSPKYIGWRAWFPLFWVEKDKGHMSTIRRLSKNPRVMFFQKYYWILALLPLALLLISLEVFLFIWLVPAAFALITLSWSTFNHDDTGPIDRGWLFGILTGGEHKHIWHHSNATSTKGEGWLNWIVELICLKN